MTRLTEDDKGILRRALSRHFNSLLRAADKCAGDLYPVLYRSEADRTHKLLQRLVGKSENILSAI
jgi:hypothetical protein